MKKRLNLVKDKLPKNRRRKTDDDDELFMLGMYNSYLKSDGYDVDATANKKIQADFPEIEGIEWLYESQVKDYENLLKRRRDKMTQTFRYMLRQNDIQMVLLIPPKKMTMKMMMMMTNHHPKNSY